ncbi:MAG: PrsW family intramembrane metalloprotease [Eubacterium sp.]|nr:PrsW family intramembrane metalloprotease [Eubacterium sp.]
MILLKLALLPSVLFCIYIYLYDKDKEPFYMALLCLIYGIISFVPISLTANALNIKIENDFLRVLYEAFITAAFPEELIKLIILCCLIYNYKDYDTAFDGIFYSVFLCMGFAAAENTGYIFHPILGGLKTALLRSVFSVPCHGIFAVIMGRFLSKNRFKGSELFPAFFVPFMLHGIYDVLLLYPLPYGRIIFLLYFAFLVILCVKTKHKLR